ncbi:MAG: DNA damage-inducible protein D [Pseudomonadota bacterium]|nr:DNA damage-inducible protein D [Pseudomonadota bacterium]
MGRELQQVLGYGTWENFEKAIEKARMACVASGEDLDDHFRETTKMILIGKGGKRAAKDFFLSRYACYLVAMNGDPSKPEIATAQTYFAVQTRRQETQDAKLLLDKRVELRNRLSGAVKVLNSAAREAGVQNYALFHDAGYRGLYSMGLANIKKRKGLGEREELFDRAGRTELAANEFRVTQAQQKIIRERIAGEQEARRTHREVGEKVRKTIQEIGGVMPEDLPPEPSLKKLIGAKTRKLPKPFST